ncbi:hypothetical protein [Saezia sanguinis]|uniref:hypothetical protein n=1 Tax=Saezia sanguinis TaxID=1965230 RepID=UPI00303393DC
MNHPHRQTNVEFVTKLMEFSKYGAMAQLFVLQALDQYAHMVANAPPERFAGTETFISAQAWQGVAKEIAHKIDHRFDENKLSAP